MLPHLQCVKSANNRADSLEKTKSGVQTWQPKRTLVLCLLATTVLRRKNSQAQSCPWRVRVDAASFTLSLVTAQKRNDRLM